MADETGVLTFLIADVRGYSRYTEEFGDEAAARLASKFVEVVTEGVEAHGGTLVEVRGDEGLAVFTSARQAIRAAVDLQAQFAEETEAEPELPLKVGIGIDSGEVVRLDDGSYRGAALNVAARLTGRAHGGDVMVSAGTTRLAGHLSGLQYSDRGRVHLKNIPDPIHIFQVYSELDAAPARRWIFMIFGRPGRTLGWKLGVAVVLVAAATAAAVVYLTTGDGAEVGSASPPTAGDTTPLTGPAEAAALPPDAGLEAIVPPAIWQDCRLQAVPQPSAIQTAVCLPAGGAARSLGDLLVQERRRSRGGVQGGTAPPRHDQAQHRQVQRVHVGRRAGVAARAGQARRARVLLLRRQRRRDRLGARAARPADPPRRPRDRPRGRQRPRRAHALVAAVAPPDRQGAVARTAPSSARCSG